MSPRAGADGRRALGNTGEELAIVALRNAGMKVIDRNWRCPAGELDIIAHDCAPDYSQGGVDATWLVVVEVRTRRGTIYGSAREAVDRRKQAKLREVASTYVQTTGWTGPWRIDVVAVQMDRSGHLQTVELIRHAVTAA